MTWILCFHAWTYYGFATKNLIVNELISVGAVGCTIFFVLSGFGLRMKYGSLLISDRFVLKSFYLKRLIALYPAYFILLMIAYLYNIYIGVSIKTIAVIMPIQLSLLQNIFSHL